ncbi:multicopper oxidase [Phanerochaete sordida]|uniref:laccase n=1 Tax=Phanerochaete sordida TaxID=48140 RepID=A0A9P3GMG5_9APHY|nr:multicopper oxidase [Phanerochaete sordida]
MQQSAQSHGDGGRKSARPRRSSVMRYAALCLPLVLASVLLALVTGAEALPHETALAARGNTVSLPSASNFVVGSIIGQPPTTRHYNFVVSEMKGAPDGFTKTMLVVNGVFPGPTIEANQGDQIVVHVTNQLQNRTTIHWHGIYQNGTNYYDGTASVTECGIPPGQSLTYSFSVADFSGTTWWHALDTQYTDGIEGALIVHPRAYPKGFPTWDEDLVVELTDVYHTLSAAIAQQYVTGDGPIAPLELETPDSGAINGIGQYNGSTKYTNFNLKPNKTYRLRLIHMGSAAQIRVSVDYHALTVIEADSTLTTPLKVAGVTLGVAQRYSVLLTTNQHAEPAGNYWLRAELASPVAVPGTNADIRAILRYGGGSALPTTGADPGVPGSGLSDLDSSKLVPAVVKTPPNPTKSYNVNFTIGGTPSGGTVATMNGTSWTMLKNAATLVDLWTDARRGQTFAPEGPSVQLGNQFMITEDSIQVVDILLINLGGGAHPFHLHGHTPYILGSGPGGFPGSSALNTVDPLTRDTFLVPSQGWLVFRIVTDNPGMWTIHCHIQWHMAAGLLMQINSLPSKSAKFNIPQDILAQCGV